MTAGTTSDVNGDPVDASLDVITPPAGSITVAGRTLDVSPIRLSELGAFSAAARPVFGFLRDMDGDNENVLFDLLERHATDLAPVLAVGARTDATWILALSLEDAATVADAVVATNRDFFIRRLLPLLAQATAIGRQTGAITSSPSPAPDSVSETSGK